jgi:hypothetical protein
MTAERMAAAHGMSRRGAASTDGPAAAARQHLLLRHGSTCCCGGAHRSESAWRYPSRTESDRMTRTSTSPVLILKAVLACRYTAVPCCTQPAAQPWLSHCGSKSGVGLSYAACCAAVALTAAVALAHLARTYGVATVARTCGVATVARTCGVATVARACGVATVARACGVATVARTCGVATVARACGVATVARACSARAGVDDAAASDSDGVAQDATRKEGWATRTA